MGTTVIRAFRAVEVIGDVAYGLKVARATVRAALDTAIRRQGRGKSFGQVSLQPLLRDSTIQMIPR